MENMQKLLGVVVLASVLGSPVAALAGEPARHVPLLHTAAAEDAPADGKTDKVWFTFFGTDYQKPILQERGFLIDMVGFFFFEIGGAIWGPMLLAGAPFDMEWVGPTLVYLIVAWVCTALAILFCWTVLGLFLFIPAFAAAWIGTEVALANLDRPEVKLEGEAPEAAEEAPKKAAPKKKK